MKFIFKYSKQTEIDRLIFTYGSIVDGSYQKHGFLLTRHGHNISKDNTVIISPHIPKLSEDIIKGLQTENICAGVSSPFDEMRNFFNQEFEDTPLLEQSERNEIEKDWRKLEKKTNELVQILFPEHNFKKVIITPTLYGTIGSYHAENQTIFITIRKDQPASYIIAMLTRTIVQYSGLKIKEKTNESLNQSEIWSEKERFTDMLMKSSALKFLCPDYKSTLEILENPELDESAVIESNNLYAKIGFPVMKALKLNGFVTKIYDKKLEGLTETQNKLLINFLKKEEQIVSNDEIAEIMWGKDYFSRYSLSAMAKMIHQLRQKLKNAGLQKEIIFTKRGKGYILIQ